jgi:HAD superfamily hydrolase (TIGR01509 family)
MGRRQFSRSVNRMNHYDYLAIFDWDGTLVDSVMLSYLVTCHLFGIYNVPPPSLDVYLAARHNDPRDFVAFYKQHGVPPDATIDELSAHWARLFSDHAAELKLREGAKETLELCRALGMGTAIVSANVGSVISAGLRSMGIEHLIDHVEARAKGKVAELRQVLQLFHLPPDRAVYIDDTFEGISAAHLAGISAIGLAGGFGRLEHLLEAAPMFCAANHQDLCQHFRQLRSPSISAAF